MNNNPFDSFINKIYVSKYKIRNCIYLYGREVINLNSSTVLIFDLSNDSYIHFGDILFYLPLILWLNKKNYNLKILCSEKNIDFIRQLKIIHDDNLLTKNRLSEFEDYIVITTPYLLRDLKNKYSKSKLMGLGMPTELINDRYPFFLSRVFCNYFNIQFESSDCFVLYEKWKSEYVKSIFLPENLIRNRYIVVSPYLGSGRFRDPFHRKKRRILKKAVELSTLHNCKIIIIGSNDDPRIKMINLNYIDFRGHSLRECINLIFDNNCIMGIGFDGIWMHYFDILSKDYLVCFRGRFKSLGKLIHINSINISFLFNKMREYI